MTSAISIPIRETVIVKADSAAAGDANTMFIYFLLDRVVKALIQFYSDPETPPGTVASIAAHELVLLQATFQFLVHRNHLSS